MDFPLQDWKLGEFILDQGYTRCLGELIELIEITQESQKITYFYTGNWR